MDEPKSEKNDVTSNASKPTSEPNLPPPRIRSGSRLRRRRRWSKFLAFFLQGAIITVAGAGVEEAHKAKVLANETNRMVKLLVNQSDSTSTPNAETENLINEMWNQIKEHATVDIEKRFEEELMKLQEIAGVLEKRTSDICTPERMKLPEWRELEERQEAAKSKLNDLRYNQQAPDKSQLIEADRRLYDWATILREEEGRVKRRGVIESLIQDKQ